MARIRGAEPSQQGILQGLFTRIVYSMTRRKVGRVVMPVQVTAHHAKLLWGYGQMEQSFASSHLVDEVLKNLAELRVATLVGCPFWIDLGSAVSRKGGITREKIEALANYQTSALFSEMERLVLDYAGAMTQTPVVVADEVFARLRANFSEAQLVELTAAIAWENYRARFDHAFGVGSEGFSEGGYCALPVRVSPTNWIGEA
jgi:alkylhydroperoxidase family enzyme